MAFATEITRSIPASSWVGGAFSALRDAWNRYRVYQRTLAELSALSTRELNDLGISRSMITRLAHEAAYGKNA
ncbi:MAG: DUF1127 domain-containing protein [Pararhodobacter sp.]